MLLTLLPVARCAKGFEYTAAHLVIQDGGLLVLQHTLLPEVPVAFSGVHHIIQQLLDEWSAATVEGIAIAKGCQLPLQNCQGLLVHLSCLWVEAADVTLIKYLHKLLV